MILEMHNIEARLKAHEQAFNSIANLIPAKYYIPVDPFEVHAKFAKSSKKKEEQKLEKKFKRKASQMELGRHLTVEEVMESKGEIDPQLKMYSVDENGITIPTAAAGATAAGFTTGAGESENGIPKRAASLEELKQRLQTRVEELRAKRTSINKKKAEKGQTKESILQNRLLKKQKMELSKEKSKHKLDHQNSLKSSELLVNNHKGSTNGESGADHQHVPTKKRKVEAVDIKVGSIVRTSDSKGDKKNKKSKPTNQQALDKVTKINEKIKAAKEENPELAEKLQADQAWKSAINKAKGIKVRDSEQLIKKSIKKKQQLKNQSAKKWSNRIDTVKTKIKEKQEKRETNIKAKKEAKKLKKMGKKVPKPKPKSSSKSKPKGKTNKSRPGFEGKSGISSVFKKKK